MDEIAQGQNVQASLQGKEGEEGNNKGEGDKDEKAKKGKADLSSPTVVKGSWVLT